MKKKSTYKATPKAKQTAKARAATPKPKAKAPTAKTVAKTQGAKKPLAKQQNIKKAPTKQGAKSDKIFPEKFPFWARLKISKRRTTLVIDEVEAFDKQKQKNVEGFMHREATHTYKKEFEEVKPNPDKDDKKSMYLKKPSKLPKNMFEPHNKKLDMPEDLQKKYDKNNKKQ